MLFERRAAKHYRQNRRQECYGKKHGADPDPETHVVDPVPVVFLVSNIANEKYDIEQRCAKGPNVNREYITKRQVLTSQRTRVYNSQDTSCVLEPLTLNIHSFEAGSRVARW